MGEPDLPSSKASRIALARSILAQKQEGPCMMQVVPMVPAGVKPVIAPLLPDHIIGPTVQKILAEHPEPTIYITAIKDHYGDPKDPLIYAIRRDDLRWLGQEMKRTSRHHHLTDGAALKILCDPEANAAVKGDAGARNIIISTSLLSRLNRAGFHEVIEHEMGHWLGHHKERTEREVGRQQALGHYRKGFNVDGVKEFDLKHCPEVLRFGRMMEHEADSVAARTNPVATAQMLATLRQLDMEIDSTPFSIKSEGPSDFDHVQIQQSLKTNHPPMIERIAHVLGLQVGDLVPGAQESTLPPQAPHWPGKNAPKTNGRNGAVPTFK